METFTSDKRRLARRRKIAEDSDREIFPAAACRDLNISNIQTHTHPSITYRDLIESPQQKQFQSDGSRVKTKKRGEYIRWTDSNRLRTKTKKVESKGEECLTPLSVSDHALDPLGHDVEQNRRRDDRIFTCGIERQIVETAGETSIPLTILRKKEGCVGSIC